MVVSSTIINTPRRRTIWASQLLRASAPESAESDLYGHRRLFLAGIVLFTLASVACGLVGSQLLLIAARTVQGLGGAVVSAVALSLIMNLFPDPVGRARAMGVYGFVCAGGGSVGVLLDGLLTGSLSWHWIFLVNLPIGVARWGCQQKS